MSERTTISRGKRRLLLAASALLTLAVGALTFLPICNLHFDCGCVTLWGGAADHCDIHDPEPPNCPWCHHPWMGWAVMALSTLAGILAILVAARHGIALATLAGLVGFHLALMALGVVTSLAMGLPVLAALR